MNAFLDLLLNGILSQPAILIGLTTLVGLLLQRKAAHETLVGTIKATMGFIILGAGAGVLVGSLNHFGALFQFAFGVQGVVPSNEAVVSLALKTYGTETALIMTFGLVMNIVFARILPWKYIFLSGHHTLYMAVLLSAILAAAGVTGVPMVIIGACVLGLTMVIFPAIGQPFMRKIIGSDDIAFGHFSTFGAAVSGWVGSLVGKGSESTEEIKMPKSLLFLRDTSVAIASVMLIFFLALALIAGSAYTSELSGGQNWFVFAIMQSLTFAAGVFIILAGVRMIIAEIVPAFKGIAMKLVPNAKPALDCPVVYPYAPTAVFLGFLSSFAGGIVSMVIMGVAGWTVIIPGVIPHFFCGANAGVFGNATGGRRGAIVGAFVHGVLISFLPIILLSVLGELGYANTTFSDSDFLMTGILLGKVASFFH